jgi:hypothetical protein
MTELTNIAEFIVKTQIVNKNMFKILMIISTILFVPVYSLSQDSKPEYLNGTLIIGEKPVGFTSLEMPDGTTDIPIFSTLPTKKEYLSNLGKDRLPLKGVKKITMTRFTREESGFIHDSCSGCSLYKATITCYGQSRFNGKTIYLAIQYILWRNTGSDGFSEPRTAELPYVDAINLNEEHK